MRSRMLPVYLTPTEYAQLKRLADREDRDPTQHARWLLRRTLHPEEQDAPENECYATSDKTKGDS